MTDWNFADVWETVAEEVPKANALVHADRRITWQEMDRDTERHREDAARPRPRSAGQGRPLPDELPRVPRVDFGILKAGMVPVNTNYRYGDDGASITCGTTPMRRASCSTGCFTENLERLRSRLPKVRGWLWVDDGSAPCPEWAVDYETAKASATERTRAPWGRSPDDLYLLYTGGTTGVPKGVMWRQDDLFSKLNSSNIMRVPEDGGLQGVRHTVKGPGPVHMPACPLMHGRARSAPWGCSQSGARW